jgi:phage gp46-like protein
VIALKHNGSYFDLVNKNGLQLDDTLETAVAISLFTDARATDDELRIAGLTKQSNRGWWGDTYPHVPGFVLGSKLWLLARAKKDDATSLLLARQYTLEALQWLIDDGVADSIIVTPQWYRRENAANGEVAIATDIYRPQNPQPRWHRLWGAISGEILEAA